MPERDRYANGTPSWIDVSTADFGAIGGFYCAVFGWTIEAVPAPEALGYSWFTLRGRRVAGLAPQAFPGDPGWTTYIEVDDCDATVAAAKEAGASVAVEPLEVLTNGKIALLSDPQGAYVALWQSRDHTGAGLVNEPVSLSWNQLTTSDVDGAVDFYERMFGWKRQLVPLGEGIPPYNMMALDGRPVAGITPLSDEADGAQPKWITHFSVADCDAMVDSIVAHGGTIATPPADSLAGRGAGCRDPQGAYFGIIQLADHLVEE